MKVLIVGAGDIGFYLTKKLSKEHDITLIDHDPQKVKRASEQLDAFVLDGHGGSLKTLRQANLEKSDIVAAMTNNDELNLIICQMAKRAGVATTIARVRNHEYTKSNFIIPQKELGADFIIHPEKETADAIRRLIRQSICTDVIDFEDGRIQLLGIRPNENSPLLGIPLKDMGQEFSELPIRIVAINRKGITLIPHGNDFLKSGDQVFVMCDPDSTDALIKLTGKTDASINNIMVLGGGLIGQFVARDTERNVHIKIIESNEEKSQEVADLLPKSLIIHGDGTDIDLLAVEGITDMDAFIAVTGNDETNIIATLVARHLKVPRTIALVNKTEYMPITPTIGMDAVVSKQLLTVNAVLNYIRGTQVAAIASIPGVDAQIIEYIASARSKITRKPLQEINFPRNALVGTICRNGDVSIPRGSTHIQEGDRVVIFSLPHALANVERLFK